jgi:TM2 domain-containing membrane protein YozV
MTIEAIVFMSFVFGLHHFYEKQATTTTICDHYNLRLLLLLLFLSLLSNMKMTA